MAEDAHAQAPPETRMWRADDLKQEGKWLSAVQCYLSVISANPDHVPAYLALAHLYMERKHWRAARDLLHRGLLHAPNDPLLNLHLGNTYIEEGMLDRAIRCYRATLKADPENAAALHNLGLALLRRGRNAEAIVALTTLAELRPDYPGLAELLGNTYLNIGRPDRALAVLLPGEARTPVRPRLLYLLALAFSAERRWLEAEFRLRKALAQSPDDAEIMRCYGWVLLQTHKPDEGIAWLRRAVATDPSLVYAHVDLAMACREQGHAEEGRLALEAALRLDPENPFIASYLREWERAETPSQPTTHEESHGARSKDRGDAHR